MKQHKTRLTRNGNNNKIILEHKNSCEGDGEGEREMTRHDKIRITFECTQSIGYVTETVTRQHNNTPDHII